MNKEIKLIAEIRHIKRRKSASIAPVFLVATTLLLTSFNAREKEFKKTSWALVGGAIATLITGRVYWNKLGNKEKEARKRLADAQRERE